jgi:hypothetical protein
MKTNLNGKNIHQGDVYLERIDNIPVGAKSKRKDKIAFGEITGHSHYAKGVTVLEKDGQEFLDVPGDNIISHEDHPKIKLPAGKYKIRIQQEYFPDGSRQVKD